MASEDIKLPEEEFTSEDFPRLRRETDVRYTSREVQLGKIVQKNNEPGRYGETNWAKLFDTMKANRGIKVNINEQKGTNPHEAMFAKFEQIFE